MKRLSTNQRTSRCGSVCWPKSGALRLHLLHVRSPAHHVKETQSGKQEADTPISAFAKELGVSHEELEGGLGPETEAPFITLDDRSWETLKKNTPKRGPGGVSGATLAATALAFWQRHAQTFEVTIQTVRATLATIHLDDPNAARSISNCAWLQERGGRIVPHPSRKSGGIRLLRAYCKGEPPPEAA